MTPGDEEKSRQIRSVLGPRLPDGALDNVVGQILEHPVSITVVKKRTSKAGDFRPPFRSLPPRITVNGNLNRYSFLITLIHELAHHKVYADYNRMLGKLSFRRRTKPLPHGEEWRREFRKLMEPYLDSTVFPADLLPVVQSYMESPKASSSADHQLSKALKQYDLPDHTIRLEELPFDAVFTLHGRRIFRKKERVRTRFRCICLKTNRTYLVSPGAPVLKIDE